MKSLGSWFVALLGFGSQAVAQVQPAAKTVDENWIVFTRQSGPFAGVMSVDQTTSSGQRGIPPYCARVDIHFAGKQLQSSGMPKGELSERYYKLDDQICKEAKDLGCRTVASRTAPKIRQIWYCASGSMLHDTIQRILPGYPEFAVKTESASFEEIRSLHPTTMEAQIAQNGQILNSLKEHGDSLDRSRNITHWILDVDTATTAELENRLPALGYRIEVSEVGKIVFSRLGKMDLDEINEETRKLNNLCDSYGCSYDGWQTEVVRS